jgi:multidrug resistance efflux pump
MCRCRERRIGLGRPVCEEDTLLLSVASTDAWLATVSVDELDINSIKVGQSVEVELDTCRTRR